MGDGKHLQGTGEMDQIKDSIPSMDQARTSKPYPWPPISHPDPFVAKLWCMEPRFGDAVFQETDGMIWGNKNLRPYLEVRLGGCSLNGLGKDIKNHGLGLQSRNLIHV